MHGDFPCHRSLASFRTTWITAVRSAWVLSGIAVARSAIGLQQHAANSSVRDTVAEKLRITFHPARLLSAKLPECLNVRNRVVSRLALAPPLQAVEVGLPAPRLHARSFRSGRRADYAF